MPIFRRRGQLLQQKFLNQAICHVGANVVPSGTGCAVFADAATLYGSKLDIAGTNIVSTGMNWRASVGVGLLWASPFGPLRVDYAVPLAKQDTDDTQEFNFGISTRF